METAGCESHVAVLATRVNGEVKVDPFDGVVTVMAEAAGRLARSKINAKPVLTRAPPGSVSGQEC